MSRYRKVDPRIWNDEKFRTLSDNGKLVFLFLLTHPGMTALGAMRATPEGLAAELKWTPKAFGEAFGEALSKGMAKHDQEACFVWLPRFLKYNEPESPNVVRAWAAASDLLPECSMKTKAIQCAKGFAEAKGQGFGKAFGEAFAHPSPNQEQEQEQEEDQELFPPTPQGGKPVEKPKSEPKRRPKLPMPDDFAVPAQWQAAAEAKFPDVDWATEAVRFVSHHRSKASVSADWRQSWTTWVHGPYEKSRKRRAATSAQATNGYVPMPGEF